MEFFQNRHIDTYVDVLHALFELEKTFNLKVMKLDDSQSNKYAICFDNKSINAFLESWIREKEKSLESSSSKEKYDEWKITFPLNQE